eukprot:6057364-Alexandrium_andersonii.AAC.1
MKTLSLRRSTRARAPRARARAPRARATRVRRARERAVGALALGSCKMHGRGGATERLPCRRGSAPEESPSLLRSPAAVT